MVYGNTAIILMVIAVVVVVLGIVCAGVYCLNKSVNRTVASSADNTAVKGG
jgi:hypothetical protein